MFVVDSDSNIPHTAQAYIAPSAANKENQFITGEIPGQNASSLATAAATDGSDGSGSDTARAADIDSHDGKPLYGAGDAYGSTDRGQTGKSTTTSGKTSYRNAGGADNDRDAREAAAAAIKWGGGDVCPRCYLQVFIAERRQAAGNVSN